MKTINRFKSYRHSKWLGVSLWWVELAKYRHNHFSVFKILKRSSHLLFIYRFFIVARRRWAERVESRKCRLRRTNASWRALLFTSWCMRLASFTSTRAPTGTIISMLLKKISDQVSGVVSKLHTKIEIVAGGVLILLKKSTLSIGKTYL